MCGYGALLRRFRVRRPGLANVRNGQCSCVDGSCVGEYKAPPPELPAKAPAQRLTNEGLARMELPVEPGVEGRFGGGLGA